MKQTRSTTKQDFSGEALSKTKHRGLTSLAFMELVPGADRVVRHICIRCIESSSSSPFITNFNLFVIMPFQYSNECPYSRRFWNDFESYWCLLSNQQVRLSLQSVIFGIISKQCPSTKLLNYFIIVGKLFLWDCRRNQIKPKIKGYQNKIVKKYETERKIKKRDYFEKKWIFNPGQKSD